MLRWIAIVGLSLTACGGSTTRVVSDAWPEATESEAVSNAVQTTTGSEVAMLRSTRSENGFYGKDAQAEINQILRFLEGQ